MKTYIIEGVVAEDGTLTVRLPDVAPGRHRIRLVVEAEGGPPVEPPPPTTQAIPEDLIVSDAPWDGDIELRREIDEWGRQT